jgi:hypothetical protein
MPSGDGIDVRGRAADVERHQLADAALALAALGQQLHGLHHGGGGRHQDAGDEGAGAREALGLDDAAEEDFADLLLGRLDVERPEAGA